MSFDIVTYNIKYRPHDDPEPQTFGVTPLYKPRKPSCRRMVEKALPKPRYCGTAAVRPSFTENIIKNTLVVNLNRLLY